ncbi:MAG TPA: hypothetical protein VED40_02460 [Azospirillaceae bacterium]|nr:hypothetical protein [Azospirillaceae bacterium]
MPIRHSICLGMLALALSGCAATAPQLPSPLSLTPPPLDGPTYIRAAAAGLHAYVEQSTRAALSGPACLGFMPRGRLLERTSDLATFAPEQAAWISSGRSNWSPLSQCGSSSDAGGAYRVIPGDRPALLICDGIDATAEGGWRMHCGLRGTSAGAELLEYRLTPEGQGFRVERTCAACVRS